MKIDIDLTPGACHRVMREDGSIVLVTVTGPARSQDHEHLDALGVTPVVTWRPVDPYNHEDGGDCLMTIQEFINAVFSGALTDDDGHGACATATHVSNRLIYPSNLDRPAWTTHVVWYNK